MNKDLLKEVEQHIRDEPDSYNQSEWMRIPGIGRAPVLSEVKRVRENDWKCGAVACVAGTAVVLSGRVQEFVVGFGTIQWREGAQEVLGLDSETADWLFDGGRYEKAMPELLRALRLGADVDELIDMEDAMFKEAGLPGSND